MSCSFFLSRAMDLSFSLCRSALTFALYSSSRWPRSSRFAARISSSFLLRASRRPWTSCWCCCLVPCSSVAWPDCRPSSSSTSRESLSFSACSRRTSPCQRSAMRSASCCFFSAWRAPVCLSLTYCCTRSIFWFSSRSWSSMTLFICSSFSARSAHFFASSSSRCLAPTAAFSRSPTRAAAASRSRKSSSRSALHSYAFLLPLASRSLTRAAASSSSARAAVNCPARLLASSASVAFAVSFCAPSSRASSTRRSSAVTSAARSC
mmetsp:Transcript_64118/g.182026  ORF Transcript_64118/g.182026 Transcript_64118/m.182026 type:complete len:264 (+) Transcript_64118:311-1102(+)